MQRHRTHRRGVELTLKLGRPDRRVARDSFPCSAREGEWPIEYPDASLPQLLSELPQGRTLSSGALQGGVAAQLQRPPPEPTSGDRLDDAVADDPSHDP